MGVAPFINSTAAQQDLLRMRNENWNPPLPKEEEPPAPPIKRKSRTEEVRESHKVRWWLHGLGALVVAVLADVTVKYVQYKAEHPVSAVAVTNFVILTNARYERPESDVTEKNYTLTKGPSNYYIRVFCTTNYSTVTNQISGVYYWKN